MFARRIQLVGRAAALLSACRTVAAGASHRATAGALSARGAPRPVRRRSEASGQGDHDFGCGVIGPVCIGPLADRGRPTRSASGLVPERSFELGGLSPVPSNRDRSSSGCLAVDSASVANRSVTCPTRLVTAGAHLGLGLTLEHCSQSGLPLPQKSITPSVRAHLSWPSLPQGFTPRWPWTCVLPLSRL
jgi:hypothetical protein